MSARNADEVANGPPSLFRPSSLLSQFMAYCVYAPRPRRRQPRQNWNEITARALTAFRDGRYGEAEELHVLALAVAQKDGRPEGRFQAAQTLRNLGVIADECGDYRGAEERLQGALFNFERCMYAPDRNDYVARTLSDLGLLYTNLGAYGRATAVLDRALFLLGGTAAADERHIEPFTHLAHVRRLQGRLEDAEKLYIRMWELTLRQYGPENRYMGVYQLGMSALYTVQARYEDAEYAAMKALYLFRTTLQPEHPRLAWPYFAWATVNREQGRYSAAEPLLRQGLLIRERSLGMESPSLLWPLETLASLLRQQGREGEAEELEARRTQIKALYAHRSYRK
jgi:tetratricopeptide (TPR) repeat protein